MPPCGACREIMMDYEEKRVVTLDKLTPVWCL